MNILKDISKKDIKVIEKNLKAFHCNYKEIYIGKCIYSKRIYVYWKDEINDMQNNYIQSFYSVYELNGWLYGMIQGKYNTSYQI
jgi:hypothetical protein